MCKHSPVNPDWVVEANCTLCMLPGRMKIERAAKQAANARRSARIAKRPPEHPAPVAKPSRFEREFAEYEAGVRCLVCRHLRDDKGRCICDRERQLEDRLDQILDFATHHSTKADHRAIAAALIRTGMDAGLRGQTGADGASRANFLNAQGRRLVASEVSSRRFTIAGDPLPL